MANACHPDWVEAGRRAPISLSLPLRDQTYDHDECAPFFRGLLPEGEFLKAVSRTLHVSTRNPFQLLGEIDEEAGLRISLAGAQVDLKVKPALVERRAAAMIDRVRGAEDAAEVIDERSERLRKALAESTQSSLALAG